MEDSEEWRSHLAGHGHDHEGHPPGSLYTQYAPVLGAALVVCGFVLRVGGVATYPWFFVAAVLVSGIPVARSGLHSLFRYGRMDINLLTTVAAAGAFLLGERTEAALVLTLFGIGEYLEERASQSSRRSVRSLLELVPDVARRNEAGAWVEVPARDLLPGDLVRVYPGESIPADGEVVDGRSAVSEANITGEPLPVEKAPGDRVFAGTLNGDGALDISVTKAAGDTEISRVARLVERYSAEKAPSQRIVDSFARCWTPAMLVAALLLSVVPAAFLGLPWRPWIYRGLTLLIVSCPCALVVSTPATVISAIARAARNGVLIKGGKHLEVLGTVRAIAFDKTGTLTTGEVGVSDIVPVPGFSSAEVLALAASVESLSEHPLARAVIREAERTGVDYVAGEEFAAVRGRGARARLRGQTVYVGNERFFLEDTGVAIPESLRERAGSLRAGGKTTVFVGNETRIAGLIAFSDSIRKDVRTALSSLERRGIRSVIMLTGDDETTARSVAKETGIGSYRSGLLPEDKVTAIRHLRSLHGRVAMVGDGVNDAPSLAAADVGIAMGPGSSDVSLEASDVVLMKDDLGQIPWVLGLGRRARNLIVQNVVFSVGIKLASMALVFLGWLPLWAAVLADSGTAVLVTLNGLRVLGYGN